MNVGFEEFVRAIFTGSKFGAGPSEPATHSRATAGAAFNLVSGEFTHQPFLASVTANMGLPTYVTVTLRREPGNRHDPNAIQALIPQAQSKTVIGHVASEIAASMATAMDGAGIAEFDVVGVIDGADGWLEVDLIPNMILTRGVPIPAPEHLRRTVPPGQEPATQKQKDFIHNLISAYDPDSRHGSAEASRRRLEAAQRIAGVSNYRDRNGYGSITVAEASSIIDQLKRL